MGFDLTTLPRPVKTYHRKTYPRISPTKSSFDGKGKTVVVTSGARGIGKFISKAFCEKSISRLVIISRSPEPQKKAKEEFNKEFPSVEVITHQVSIAEHDKVNKILRDLGSVDVLVLSATFSNDQNIPTMQVPLADIQECFDTNVVAAYNLIHTFLELPPPKHNRTVINISSAAAAMTHPGSIGYGPSKAAITQIISHFDLAQKMGQLQGDNSFYSIHPGAIRTDKTNEMEVPMDAVSEWEDVNLPAHYCVWLASDEAKFLSGKYTWAAWDVDELVALKPKLEQNPFLLSMGLIQ